MITSIVGYIHTQAEASTTWVVPHALNCSPTTQVYINYGGKLQRVLPKDIVINSPQQLTISFRAPQTGKVVLQ